MTSRRLAKSAGSAAAPVPARTEYRESTLEFPGCRPVRITRDAIEEYEGRLEYWDADTETAWVAREPTTVWHEGPGQQLGALLTRIAAIRGAPILTLGTADLLLRNARGERHRILQADQMVFLDPLETRPTGAAVEVGADHLPHLPDVVLEVDYSTDVRRGKLSLYEEWGFPEVWVDVPEGGSPRLRPGLTIHQRAADGYRTVAASVALAGWTAAEIHRALNEPKLSEATRSVLERVGRVLGEAAGTGPDDDPWLGAHRREARAEGHAEGVEQGRAEGRAEGRSKGRAEGRAKGHAEGRAEGRAEGIERGIAATVPLILRNRGLTVSDRLPALLAYRLAVHGPEALVAAALACRDEADLLARLDEQPGPLTAPET